MEAERLDERDRRNVPRLDVGLEAVQPELAKGVVEDETEAFAHVSLPGERHANVIAQVGALKRAPHDLTELDGAKQHTIGVTTEEKANEVGPSTTGEVVRELGGRLGRRDPGLMKSATAAVEGEDRGLIGAAEEGEVNPRAMPGRGGDYLPGHLNESQYS